MNVIFTVKPTRAIEAKAIIPDDLQPSEAAWLVQLIQRGFGAAPRFARSLRVLPKPAPAESACIEWADVLASELIK